MNPSSEGTYPVVVRVRPEPGNLPADEAAGILWDQLTAGGITVTGITAGLDGMLLVSVQAPRAGNERRGALGSPAGRDDRR